MKKLNTIFNKNGIFSVTFFNTLMKKYKDNMKYLHYAGYFFIQKT